MANGYKRKDIQNPYSGFGVSVPDPSYYVFGADSAAYQGEVNNYNHAISRAEWESQMALMDDNREYQEYIYNKYNSPLAQVKQMHAAGLNPDLQNIDPTEANASSMVPQGNKPTINSDGGHYGQMAQQFISLIPQAISMVSGLRSQMLDNSLKSLSIEQVLSGIVGDDLSNVFGPGDFVKDADGNFPNLSEEQINYILNRSSTFKHMSKYLGKSYHHAVANLLSGNRELLKDRVYSKFGSGAESRSKFISLLSQHGFNMPDEDFAEIIRDFNKIVFESSKSGYQTSKMANDNKLGMKLMNQGIKNIEDGNYFRGAIEYVIGTLIESQISFSRSSGPKGNSSGMSVGF